MTTATDAAPGVDWVAVIGLMIAITYPLIRAVWAWLSANTVSARIERDSRRVELYRLLHLEPEEKALLWDVQARAMGLGAEMAARKERGTSRKIVVMAVVLYVAIVASAFGVRMSWATWLQWTLLGLALFLLAAILGEVFCAVRRSNAILKSRNAERIEPPQRPHGHRAPWRPRCSS